MVLFIVKNPLWKCSEKILDFSGPKDKVLLIQDGVLILNSEKSRFLEDIKKKRIELLALKEDLELRGIKNRAKAVLVSYDGFVDLIENNRVVS